jgi:hypothetical protein
MCELGIEPMHEGAEPWPSSIVTGKLCGAISPPWRLCIANIAS